MDLKKIYLDHLESGYKTWPTYYNTYNAQEILKKTKNGTLKFTNMGLHHGILNMLLFGIEIPKCYFTEDNYGHRICIHGDEILSTVVFVLENSQPDSSGGWQLFNKIAVVDIPFVTFNPDTPQKQIEEVISSIVTINREVS